MDKDKKDPTIPRPPTAEERAELAAWLREQAHGWHFLPCPLSPALQRFEDGTEGASIAVFDNYCSDGPGYFGRVMVVVWTGGPGIFQAFTWDCTKKLEEEKQEWCSCR